MDVLVVRIKDFGEWCVTSQQIYLRRTCNKTIFSCHYGASSGIFELLCDSALIKSYHYGAEKEQSRVIYVVLTPKER